MNPEMSHSYAILTIDDIPSTHTEALVDYLNELGIQVVMFAIGEQAAKHPESVIYALQHGMIVGNHSYTHPDFSKLSFEEGVREIEQCDAVLDEIYDKAGVIRRFRPFRFPYGNKGGENKDRLQQYLLEKGYSKLDDTRIRDSWWQENGLDRDIDTLWSFDFCEYQIREGSGFTLEDVWKRVQNMHPASGSALLAAGSHHIILMHDHDETRALVPDYDRQMLRYVLERGVVFDRPAFITPQPSL